MFNQISDFTYASGRAQQEEVAAINARCEASAAIHEEMARLYAKQAGIACVAANHDHAENQPV